MTDLRKAAEMALGALESWQKTCLDCGRASEELGRATTPIQALRQALAQPEQEPVAWMCEGNDWCVWKPTVILGNDLETHKKSNAFRNWEPLYAAPPKREWVGLTDEEKEQATGWSVEHIEASLKEKNT